jgi:hypothetical protein
VALSYVLSLDQPIGCRSVAFHLESAEETARRGTLASAGAWFLMLRNQLRPALASFLQMALRFDVALIISVPNTEDIHNIAVDAPMIGAF